MEFLVQFDVTVPAGISDSELKERERAEARAAEALADQGRLVRLWSLPSAHFRPLVLGLYRAANMQELNNVLSELPLHEWMTTTVTPLVSHPNDPGIRAG
jgi:muconolactone D-isomerase